MTEFRLESDFLELFPDATIAIAVVRGIDNRVDDPEIWPMLETEIERAAASVSDEEISQHPAVAPWRAAFARFGVKPSKYRSSIEAMLRSAQSGRLRSIDPLVDLYNTISLRHQLPVGSEDLMKIVGDIRLTRAHGDELFVPLGAEAPESPPPGAVIYRDDESVICSCWNWREAERTMLTAETTDAVVVIESIPPLDPDAVRVAIDDLAALVVRHLGGTAEVSVLTQNHPAVTLSNEAGS
ncbi:MAG TPA: phenylalanine--tRNA ligase beta subunit-related protein [Thermomicrobiales bacterium]|nr:phenylalanine--tRNA ligase beta subunit-related protein [Thermomicrobiales bacterium]